MENDILQKYIFSFVFTFFLYYGDKPTNIEFGSLITKMKCHVLKMCWNNQITLLWSKAKIDNFY